MTFFSVVWLFVLGPIALWFGGEVLSEGINNTPWWMTAYTAIYILGTFFITKYDRARRRDRTA